MTQRIEIGPGQERMKRHGNHLVLLSLAMAITLVGTAYVLEQQLLSGAWAAIASVIPAAFGIAATVEYRRFLRQADELQRKVQLEALAFGFSVGVLGGMTYSMLAAAHIVEVAKVGHVVAAMFFAYSISVLVSTPEILMKNRIKVLRAERDWTQADLARELDVSRQTVNAIETGKYDPALPLAFQMARLFKLRIEDIFQDDAGVN